MYRLQWQANEELPYAVLDAGGRVMARVGLQADAHEVVAALNLVERAARLFPGLADGETPVSGADLVDLFGAALEFDGGRYRQR